MQNPQVCKGRYISRRAWSSWEASEERKAENTSRHPKNSEDIGKLLHHYHIKMKDELNI